MRHHHGVLRHSEPAALHLLGLSVSNCTKQALHVTGGGQVLLLDVKLAGNNAPDGDGQLGGAALVERTQKVRPEAWELGPALCACSRSNALT